MIAPNFKDDAICQKKWGCSLAEWSELHRVGQEMLAAGQSPHRRPLRAYAAQKRHAARRGIAWEFNAPEWWKVWCDSGKWELRGRADGYQMCRLGDKGPYSASNVYIATGAQNILDKPEIENRKLPIGVSFQNNRFRARYRVKGKRFYCGSFEKIEEAHSAYLAAKTAVLEQST